MNFLKFSLLIPVSLFVCSCKTFNSNDNARTTFKDNKIMEYGYDNIQTNSIILHVDELQRIVTLKSDINLEKGYFISNNPLSGNETSVIKLLSSSHGNLYMGDILEGRPSINDFILKATKERSESLREIYNDPAID